MTSMPLTALFPGHPRRRLGWDRLPRPVRPPGCPRSSRVSSSTSTPTTATFGTCARGGPTHPSARCSRACLPTCRSRSGTGSNRLFALFVAMAFTMGLAYLVYDKLTHRSALLVSYLVVLICSLGLYYALRGERWFAKHLTYRALAETLRVTFYLRLAGIDQRLDAARVLALSGINRFRGFSLITHVLAHLAVPDAQAGERRAPDAERSRCMEREWIEGQYRYFTAKVAQLRRKGRRIKILKNALFATIVLGMIGMILSQR